MKKKNVLFAIIIALFLISISTLSAQKKGIKINDLSSETDVQIFSLSSKAVNSHLISSLDDPFLINQWALFKINAQQAWTITTGSPNIKIAVIDDGIDMNHEEFIGQLVPGWDYFENDGYPQASGNNNHGNACAGIISAKANNALGIVGLAYNCKIMPLRIDEDGTDWSVDKLKDAINFAKDSGVDVISISLQSRAALQGNGVEEAINNAVAYGRNGKGCIVVVAAGNDAKKFSNLTYPARYGNSFSVGATDQNDLRWDYSCYGSALRVVAPSGNTPVGDIWTTDLMGPPGGSPTNYVSNFGGTSAAAPLVAGLAALVLSKDPWLTRTEVQTIIEQTAIDLGASGRDDYYGWGRIDAWNALRITTSGTLPGHEVWRGNISLTANVIVPSNTKLTILSNAKIYLNGYSIISTGGTISKEDGAIVYDAKSYLNAGSVIKGIHGLVQSAINNWSTGQTVKIISGTVSENFSASGKSGIKIIGTSPYYTTLNGNISISNCPDLELQSFKLNSGSITLQNCSNVYIGDVEFVGAAYPFLAYNSSGSYYLDAVNSSYIGDNAAYFNACSGDMDEVSIKKHGNGVYLTNYSYINIYEPDFCGNGYDIYAAGSSWVYVGGGIASADPAPVYGSVMWTNYSECSSPKRMTVINNNNKNDPGYKEFEKLNELYSALLKRIKEENKEKTKIDRSAYANDYKNITYSFKDFVNSNAASPFAKTALIIITHFYKEFNDYDGLITYLQSIINNKKLVGLSDYSRRYIMDYYSYQKEFAKAILLADEIINTKGIDIELIGDVLYAKGLIYQYSMKNEKEAINTYMSILTDYPECAMIRLAKHQLKGMGIEVEENKKKELVTEETEKLKFDSNNFPNPFNPTTTISFTLPEDGKVLIKIFDVLGREVATLIDGFKNKGTHSVVWNGSKAVSGIYFYNITYKEQTMNKKMLLMK